MLSARSVVVLLTVSPVRRARLKVRQRPSVDPTLVVGRPFANALHSAISTPFGDVPQHYPIRGLSTRDRGCGHECATNLYRDRPVTRAVRVARGKQSPAERRASRPSPQWGHADFSARPIVCAWHCLSLATNVGDATSRRGRRHSRAWQESARQVRGRNRAMRRRKSRGM